jgi:hypothetical protein
MFFTGTEVYIKERPEKYIDKRNIQKKHHGTNNIYIGFTGVLENTVIITIYPY